MEEDTNGTTLNPAPPTALDPGEGLSEAERIKEVCRLIRLARSRWDAHDNGGCRRERNRAAALYGTLTEEQKDQVPQALRVWLRYRSEKYFGPRRKIKKKRTPPGS